MPTATKRKKAERTTQGSEPANLQSDEQLAASLQHLEFEVEVATVKGWNRQQWAEAADYVDRMGRWVEGGQMLPAPVPPEFLEPYRADADPGTVAYEGPQNIRVDRLVAKFNPRKTFDEGKLSELAESMKKHGQLQDVVCKKGDGKTYEIIAGERRVRAARKAKLETVRCQVLDITDEEAIELAGIENVQREDLDPIEEAGWYRMLLDHCNYKQRSLAKRLGCSQSQIANRLRLLKLPEAWQQRVISREIPPTHAREIVAWADRPAVLEQVDAKLTSLREQGMLDDDAFMPLDEWRHKVLQSVHDVTKPLDKHAAFADVPLFKLTAKRETELEPVDVPCLYQGGTERRTFHVERWEELQAEAKRRQREKAQRERGRQPAAGAAAEEPPHEESDRCPAEHRFHSQLESWCRLALQEAINTSRPKPEMLWPLVLLSIEDPQQVAELAGGSDGCTHVVSDLEVWQRLKGLKPSSLRSVAVSLVEEKDSMLPMLDLPTLVQMAADFGVDVRKRWQPDDELLSAFPLKRLRETAHDILGEHDFSTYDKTDLVEQLREKWPPGRMMPEVAEVLRKAEGKDEG